MEDRPKIDMSDFTWGDDTVESIITGSKKNEKKVVMINGIAVSQDGLDPNLAVMILGPYYWVHIVIMNALWWGYVPTLNIRSKSAFWWTWCTGYIVVMMFFLLPAIGWIFTFIDYMPMKYFFMIFGMGSIGGPMLAFWIPFILALVCYIDGWTSGYLVNWNRRGDFWVPWFFFIMWNAGCIYW
jgi:hypothetical protein